MSAKILKALHDIMSKVGYVQKAQENKFHGYKYAGEAQLLAVLRPAMVEAGLLLIPSVTEARGPDEYGNTTVKIEYTLAHKDGDIWPTPVCGMGCGNDRNTKGGIGDKGIFKAITGANKYALFKLFQIETGDDPEESEVEHEATKAKPTARAPGAPASLPPAIVEFFNRASYEMPGDDLLAIADKVVKASGHAWHPDQLLQLEEDNKDHIAALHNQAPASWKDVQTALSAARKRLTVLAA